MLRGWLAVLVMAGVAEAGEHAVFKSLDRGRSWTRADAGLPKAARVNSLGSIGDVVFAGTDEGIFISRDKGGSWKRSGAGRALGFATVGQTVFAGTDGNGVLMSADRGATWVRNAGVASPKVRSMLADQDHVYAGTDADGVMMSADEGRTWTRMQEGLPRYAQIFAMAMVKGRLYAGLYGRGLYAWNGRWVKAGTVLPLVLAASGETLVAGHNPGGSWWSKDQGTTWTQSTGEVSSTAPVWEMAAGEGMVYAGAADGIYYSEDRAQTWTRTRKGLPEKSPGVSFLVRRDFVLAGTLITAIPIK